MSILTAIINGARRSPIEKRSATADFLAGLDLLGTSTRTKAGINVDDSSALQLSAVYGSVRILSDGISTLPISVTRGKGSQAEDVLNPPAWVLKPNPTTEMHDLLSQVMTSLLMRGNAYLLTVRGSDFKVTSVHVLDPSTVEVSVSNRVKTLVVTTSGGKTILNAPDFVHISGMMLPGANVGTSPIDFAKESIALGLAAQDMGAAFFGNGAVPGAIIEVAGEMSEPGVKLLQRAWNEMHRGSGNSHKLAVLTEGAQFKPIAATPDQAQFLQTRAFQVADIARFFGVPPHLLADASGSTSWGTGLAEQDRAYVTHALRPWVVRIEAHLSNLAQSEQRGSDGPKRLYVGISVEGLLRGDWATRMTTYGPALDRGIYSVNEVRAFEGLPPIGPEGDVHRSMLSTAPAGPSEGEDTEPKADTEPASVNEEERVLLAANVMQKMYLAVGKVVTVEEARSIVSRIGFDLPGGLPEELQPDAEPVPAPAPEPEANAPVEELDPTEDQE